jgi:hypothetical protein
MRVWPSLFLKSSRFFKLNVKIILTSIFFFIAVKLIFYWAFNKFSFQMKARPNVTKTL